MTNIHTDLDESNSICERATAGPWQVLNKRVVRYAGDDEDVFLVTPHLHVAEDVEFIAHARTKLPVRNAQVAAVLEVAQDIENRGDEQIERGYTADGADLLTIAESIRNAVNGEGTTKEGGR